MNTEAMLFQHAAISMAAWMINAFNFAPKLVIERLRNAPFLNSDESAIAAVLRKAYGLLPPRELDFYPSEDDSLVADYGDGVRVKVERHDAVYKLCFEFDDAQPERYAPKKQYARTNDFELAWLEPTGALELLCAAGFKITIEGEPLTALERRCDDEGTD